MLTNCKPGCVGKRVTTNVLLDVKTNQAVCEFCDEIVEVSSFAKNSMRHRGDIKRVDNRKSCQFNCLTCKQKVETFVEDEKLLGVDCEGDCKFNVSSFTIHAMKNVVVKTANDDETEEDE